MKAVTDQVYSGGYYYTNFLQQTCVGVASVTSIQTANCVSGTSDTPSYLTLPTTITASPGDAAKAITTTITAYTLWAPLIQLNFQASDLGTTTTTSASSGSSASAITSSLPSSPTSAAPTSPSQAQTTLAVSQHSTGFSTGAKAGIGVAAGVAAVAIVAALALWLLYRRSRLQSRPKDESGTWELIGVRKRPYPSVSELSQPAPELPQPIPELAISRDPRAVHELGT